jgi:hypothetical protein
VPPTNVPVTVAGLLVDEEDRVIDGLDVKAKLVIGAPLFETVKATSTVVEFITVTPVIAGVDGFPAPAKPYERGLIPREPKIGDIKDSYYAKRVCPAKTVNVADAVLMIVYV